MATGTSMSDARTSTNLPKKLVKKSGGTKKKILGVPKIFFCWYPKKFFGGTKKNRGYQKKFWGYQKKIWVSKKNPKHSAKKYNYNFLLIIKQKKKIL